MKQNFRDFYHDKFIKHFWIQSKESDVEIKFYEKTIKYIGFIKWIPWLKMVWVWNSVSMNCATKKSDIDLFIVTSPNSMWFNRILITLIFSILWVRKTRLFHSWRFCLSFFATTDWLDFSSWCLENDVYLYFWLIYFKPILSYDNTYELFIEKNNSWALTDDYSETIERNKKYIMYSWKSKAENCKLISFFDFILKKIFKAKTIRNYNKLWKPYWVIINDNMLKFHNNDVRKEIIKNFF